MSKEKQKFFRSSAFNADKKRDKRNNSDGISSDRPPKGRNSTKADEVKTTSNKQKPSDKLLSKDEKVLSRRQAKKPASSSSSSSECSSSSDDSDSSDSDSDSSSQLSDCPEKCPNLKVPTMFTSNGTKLETFGSVSGLNLGKDGVWGFAAAAAEAAKKDGETPAENDKTDSNVDKSRSATGFTQLKGLFDGLSHLFATPSETRSRPGNTVNYNPNRRKKNEKSETTKEEKVEVDDVIKPSNPPPPPLPVHKPPYSSTFFLPADDNDNTTQMTPSNLVKKAVDSKRHELERRKFLKAEPPGFGTASCFSHNAMLVDARMKKRNLIAEATQTNHPLSVLPIANNQTGKIGLPTHESPVPRPFP